MQEQEMIRLLRRNDPQGLEALMDRYIPYVSTIAARILVQHPEQWEELTADVFLTAWEHRKQLQAGHVKSWLGAVARNRAFNILRSRKEHLPLEEDVLPLVQDTPQLLLERKEEEKLVRHALDQLDRESRELFVRHYYYGQTVAQAAREMDINVSTAKARLRRGREKLKEFLQKAGYCLDGYENFQADGQLCGGGAGAGADRSGG